MVRLGKADGAAGRAALGVIATSLVLGLAACGNPVTVSGGPATGAPPKSAEANRAFAQPRKTTSPAGQINPGGPMMPATSKHVLLCREIPKLTRMTVIRRAGAPPLHHVREVLPAGFIIRNAATVQRIATMLCALPTLPSGFISCPDLVGGSFQLFFGAPGKAIPSVGIQYSGCRVVSGLGPPRTWASSAAMQHEVSAGFGDPFRLIPPNA
jgi:hypothetical protein